MVEKEDLPPATTIIKTVRLSSPPMIPLQAATSNPATLRMSDPDDNSPQTITLSSSQEAAWIPASIDHTTSIKDAKNSTNCFR